MSNGDYLLWAVLQITESGCIFSTEESGVLIVTKYGLGYILGDFFINSSGHPGPQ
jgi:hypothetical protein